MKCYFILIKNFLIVLKGEVRLNYTVYGWWEWKTSDRFNIERGGSPDL